MLGIGKLDVAGIFRGRELEMVCFAAYQVNLHFSGGVSLRFQGCFVQRHLGTESAVSTEQPISNSCLPTLLQKRVSVASAAGDRLLLVFDDGEELELYENKNYESFQIRTVSGEINV